jgi:small conductance mechanosensitive channel
VITGRAPGDRISGVSPLPAPPPAPLGPLATSGGDAGGWLYSLLTQAGVSPHTAHSVNDFVVRPLGVVLIVVVAALLAHYGARAIRRVLGRVAQQAAGRGHEGRAGPRAVTVVALMGNLWRLVVVLVAIALILGMLGIDLTPLLASATIIGATIGFGAQSLVRDYLSGILLTMEDQFGIGDMITVGGATGVVEDLSLRVTRLRAADGSVWYVPNGDIRELTNSSRGWAKAVVDVPVVPGDETALDRARAAVDEAARSVAGRPEFAAAAEPPEVVGMVAADAGTATLRVALRTTPAGRAALERALREAVLARLAAEGLWPGTQGPPGQADAPAAGHPGADEDR